MDALFEIDDGDVLRSWLGGRGRRRGVAEPSDVVVPGVRFAFYGRTSTAEFQDPVTSRAWQREVAATLVAGHGTITAEFFDVGCSRRVSWERRPEAAALLEQAQGGDRPFDAVVVGEFERAFTDRQFEQVAGRLRWHGIRVWLPEAGGPVDLDAPTHRVLMQVLAAQSQREVVRSRHRTVAAMTAQTIEQAGSSAAGHRTVTSWWTPVRIRTRRTLRGDDAVVGWHQILLRRRTSGGCSLSAAPGAAWPGLPAS